MAGRTHLQHALPITFGFKCAVWLAPLERQRERLGRAAAAGAAVQFGGAAGTLASLGDDGIAGAGGAGRGAGARARQPMPWHVARDGLAEAVGFLGLLTRQPRQDRDRRDAADADRGRRGARSRYVARPRRLVHHAAEAQPDRVRVHPRRGRGVQALVPVMLDAMVADHERATGPWQAEWLALPQAFGSPHGALRAQPRMLRGARSSMPARMRRNLDATGGLIVAEAVMMGLAPALGRAEAHHVVARACDAALRDGISLAAALAREPAVAAKLDAAAIGALTDPARYLGSTATFIDRALAAAADD